MAAMLYGLMEFPEKLRWLMKEHRYSQEGLATKLEVSQGLVANWLHRRNVPGLALAVKLARVLNVSMDYLFDDRFELMDAESLRCDREIRRIIAEIGEVRVWRRLVEAGVENLLIGEPPHKEAPKMIVRQRSKAGSQADSDEADSETA